MQDLKNKKIIIGISIFLMILFGSYFIYNYLFKKPMQKESIISTSTPIETVTSSETTTLPLIQFPKATQTSQEIKSTSTLEKLDLGQFFSTSTDIHLEGVEIVYKENSKLVINHKEKYQIEIPQNLILNQTLNTQSLYFDSLDLIQAGFPTRYWTQIAIFVWSKGTIKEEWYQEKYNLIKDSKNPKITINGIRFTRVFMGGKGPDEYFDAYSYLTLKDNKIYEIFITSKEVYGKYVQTFQFLKE